MENLSAAQEQDEIIIKCGLEEIAKAFFQDFEIIWHDPKVNSQENQQYRTQLETLCRVQTFTDWKEAENYIKTAKTVCHVITSGTNGELFVKEIFSSQNVPEILTFCRNEEYHSAWAKNYNQKVLCTETKIEDVIAQIQKNLLEWHKQTSSLKFDLPAFAPIFDDWDKSQMNYLHLYLKVIPNFSNRLQAKDDFLALSKAVYSDETNKKHIANFEQTYNEYNKEEILKWYTQQSFLYKVVNNCLRIATSDSIQWSRLLLKDIETAIKDGYKTKSNNFSGVLYRAAFLSEKEWSSLKENMNREIEMHGFLSVSKEKKIALKFMRLDPTRKVFITIIVPKGPVKEQQGFAEIEEFSKFPKEKEVLFNVRSRFTILEAEDKYSADLSYRHLVLLYGAQGLRKFITEEGPAQQLSLENVENISCSHCKVLTGEMAEKLLFMSIVDPEKPIYSCKNCLDNNAAPFLCISATEKVSSRLEIKGCLLKNSSQVKIPMYGYQCSKCGAKNQERYFVCTDCGEKGKRWCENCFGKTLSCTEMRHAIILENSPLSFWCEKMLETELNHSKYQNDLVANNDNTFQQGKMYIETHEYEKAIEYYNRSFLQNGSKYSINQLRDFYSGLGTVYFRQGEYSKALEYYFKSLDIKKSVYGEDHPLCATSYIDIGSAFYQQGEYKKALDYHLKSLKILKSASSEIYPDVATSYHNIGLIYEKQGEHTKALKYHLKALKISKLLFGENHPYLAMFYNLIGSIYNKQEEHTKALEYLLKSLDITKLVHGENHPNVAASYHNIGITYNKQGEPMKALEYESKSLSISKSFFGENHPFLAASYENIGSAFIQQGEYKKAFEYQLKSLDITKSIHGENHPNVATTYHNIGSTFYQQGKYNQALEYHLKSLDIRKSFFAENHSEIASSFQRIGAIYSKQEEHMKALKYLVKSLDIKKSVYGENHPNVADSYYDVGVGYGKLGEYMKAFEYLLKSLDLSQSTRGKNHPKTIKLYNLMCTMAIDLN